LAKTLDNYSIESDNTVYLSFSDGTETRTSFDKLCDLLGAEDQQKVQRGMNLRKNYFRRNLGSVAKYLAIASILLLAGYDSVRAAQIIMHNNVHHVVPAAPAPQPTKTVTPTIATTPVTQPSPAAVTPVAASSATSSVAAPVTTKQTTPVEQLTAPVQQVTQAVPPVVHGVTQVVQQVLTPIFSPLAK